MFIGYSSLRDFGKKMGARKFYSSPHFPAPIFLPMILVASSIVGSIFAARLTT
jgi:hypothetical protein